MARVHAQDELSVSVLAEAFAELGEQAAKREALAPRFRGQRPQRRGIRRDVRHGPGHGAAQPGLGLNSQLRWPDQLSSFTLYCDTSCACTDGGTGS